MSAEPDRPSARAVERLATGVGEDVADLRTQLHRALDEAGRLQAAGREDLAVSVLQEQRDVLLAVHNRLESRLAEAAVEREAEQVLQGAASAPRVPDPGPVAAVQTGDDGMALRLLASAVAAVLGIALLVSPDIGPGRLTAAGSSAASDALQGSASSRAADAAGDADATLPAAAGGESGGNAHVTDLRGLALPEADALRHRARNQDGGPDADPTDPGELPLADIEPTVDALTSLSQLPADPEDDDPAASESDAGAAAGDHDDSATQSGGEGETASEESAPESGTSESSQDTTADRDEGADGATSEGAGSTDRDQAAGDDGASGADDGDTSGGDLGLGDASGGPMAVER